jgi:hypothetical protein
MKAVGLVKDFLKALQTDSSDNFIAAFLSGLANDQNTHPGYLGQQLCGRSRPGRRSTMIADINGDLRWASRRYSFVATFVAGMQWQKM